MTVTTAAGQSARRARTRERLMDAASEVFAENGYAASSLDMICERAGLTRGAFHYNFASREELLLAVMGRDFDATLASLESIGDLAVSGEGGGELLETLLALYSNRGHDFVAWSRLSEEFRLYAMRDAAAAAAHTEHFRRVHERLGAAIQQAADAHGLRLLTSPETTAAITTGTFLQAVSDGVLAGLADREIQSSAAERVLVTLQALMPRA